MQCVVCTGAYARRCIFQISSDFRIRNGGTCSEVVEVLMHKFKCSMLQFPCHAYVLKDLVLQAAEYSRQLVYVAEASGQHCEWLTVVFVCAGSEGMQLLVGRLCSAYTSYTT